uniref:Uncharacterized protein n=2 Tax=Fopius arisanus TaxID=64838 RepID=A0A0C9R4B9_9HYME
MVAAGATALMAAGDSGASKTADNGGQEGQLSGEGERRRTSAFATRRKDSSITPNKTASIRETKTSRLRAASIVSPTADASTVVRRSGLPETSRSSPHTSSSNLSTTQKNPRVSGIPQIFLRERERHRHLPNRGADVHEKLMDSTAGERIPSRRPKKPSKLSPPPKSSRTPSRPSSIPSLKTSPYTSTEVLQRVDALTALTRATMERVERLASSSPSSVPVPIKSPRIPKPKASLEDSKSPQVVHPLPPISILKHKSSDPSETEAVTPLPTVAFALSTEKTRKKHGILKKRCSLDENEILRRSSASPDSILIPADSPEGDYRPILKYERRSSLDELVKHPKTDQTPPSILKNRWSRSNDEEDSEPQGILKKHPQSIVDAVAKSLGVTWTELESDKKSEVRPILKKKFSHDESSSSDPPSLEPRPILKKKSSTDSDEHEPRKTILKYRKNSEDSSNECETVPNSPRKLSVLKQHSLQRRTNSLPECDALTVKPILKNSRSRSVQGPPPEEVFLRKRAGSVGHEDGKWPDGWRREGCGKDNEKSDKESDSVVTFELPGIRLGFCSEEAAGRRLDDLSAKIRRDKRVSRRFRDRREMQNLTMRRESPGRGGNIEETKTVVVEFQGVDDLDLGRIKDMKEMKERDGRDGERFCTQPVTCQEVREAKGMVDCPQGNAGDHGDEDDEGDEGDELNSV